MLNRRHFLTIAGATATFCALKPPLAFAADPILTLHGSQTGGDVASSLAEMDAFPQTSFATTTPWHQGVVKFSGVSLKDYLAALKVDPKQIRLVALNDYSVDAEVAGLLEGDALLATRQNDQPMPVSDKGPVFLVFPFDSRAELQHQTYYSRSVWQLTEIDILA
ncbi:oxidoreductase [Aureimonas endophytica]|uniref:Oxidoreductase n=1 Tax=Aureimonas endophytica TaxID=2027858 RepID=A0A916ZQR1_9HYPH|nr:molybdopterin-dependent oxidoreductase [Aureimonas endophytica]GGE09398.1 oxidoreductase [Aureimonas endophytica]